MKKAVVVLLAILLCLSLCACGKYEKYDTLIGYIEAGDEENAVNELHALLQETMPEVTEPATTTVEITMDNWQEYFEIVLGAGVSRDAFDEIETIYSKWSISLKEEFREALIGADVAFGYRASEYSKCAFIYDLQTEQMTMSVISPSDRGSDSDGTCSFEYDNSFVTLGDNFSVSLLISLFATLSKPSVDGNKATWQNYEYAKLEITRVQGTLTLKAE